VIPAAKQTAPEPEPEITVPYRPLIEPVEIPSYPTPLEICGKRKSVSISRDVYDELKREAILKGVSMSSIIEHETNRFLDKDETVS
jgi:hypothetical protein